MGYRDYWRDSASTCSHPPQQLVSDKWLIMCIHQFCCDDSYISGVRESFTHYSLLGFVERNQPLILFVCFSFTHSVLHFVAWNVGSCLYCENIHALVHLPSSSLILSQLLKKSLSPNSLLFEKWLKCVPLIRRCCGVAQTFHGVITTVEAHDL